MNGFSRFFVKRSESDLVFQCSLLFFRSEQLHHFAGKKRPPDREPVLRETWLKVVKMLGRKRLVIGGKSMGGRIASLVADEARVADLVCLGYPFHPVRKPDRLRVQHLQTIKTPTLIIQGERDSFGNREDVAGYRLSGAVRIQWIEDGDHSLKPHNWDAAIKGIVELLTAL